MDFITDFSKTSRKHDSIMVLVDRLTKVAHFIPMKSTYSYFEVAQVFIREIVIFHGIPKNIVSDIDVKVHFQFLEGFVYRFGDRVGL